MRRISLIAIIMLGAYMAAPVIVNAATVSFSPSSLDGTAGSASAFSVLVEPAGDTAYTVRLELNYPEDVLDFVSFEQADGWIALPQEGYDAVDEDEGIIVKTAGFPGGVSAPRTFGTFTFVAASAGSDALVATNATLVLDATNTDIAEGLPVQMSVEYSEPVVEPSQPTESTPQDTEPTVVGGGDTEEETDTEEVAEEEVVETGISETQTAAVGSVGDFPWMTLLAIVLAIIAGTFAYLWKRERRQ